MTDGFVLRSDDDGGATGAGVRLRAGQLAARLIPGVPISESTVAVWRKAGMPHAGKDAGGWWYDLEACRAWAAKNRPHVALMLEGGDEAALAQHGGKRPGGGRPLGSGRGRGTKAQRHRGTKGVGGGDGWELGVAASEGGEATRGGGEEPSLLDAKIRRELAQAEKLELENAVTRGELLRKDEAAGAWARALVVLGSMMDSAPARTVPKILAECELPAAMAPVVKRVLEEMMRDLRRELVADPLGEAGGKKTEAA